MKIFLALTTLINIGIVLATSVPTVMGLGAGGISGLQGFEKIGWIIILGLPVIGAVGAILPWFLQRNGSLAVILAMLPAVLLGTIYVLVETGLVT